MCGFTLVELLVVVAIIGLLASIFFASLSDSRLKARDARRLADLKEIQNALELFFDHYGFYPSSVDSNPADTVWDNSGLGDGFILGLTGDNARNGNPNGVSFLSSVPGEPFGDDGVNSTCGQSYAYWSDGDTYTIVVHPEVSPLQNIADCGQFVTIYDICFYSL